MNFFPLNKSRKVVCFLHGPSPPSPQERWTPNPNYKPKLWILALHFLAPDMFPGHFADARNNLQCFCSICSEDGRNKYFKLINVAPAVPGSWLASLECWWVGGERRKGRGGRRVLFVHRSSVATQSQTKTEVHIPIESGTLRAQTKAQGS